MRSWWWVKEKKKQMALVLIIVTMMILQFQMKGCVGCVETERMGLLQLKSYLNSLRSPEAESILDTWSDDDPQSDCCNWKRVTCSDAIGGRIVDLSLYGHTYRWTTSDQHRGLNLSLLHSFPGIKTLDFSWNQFDHLFDPIHGYKSFQRLENLESLDLMGNQFNSSVLPFISAARSLRILKLGNNRLEGVIPLNGNHFSHNWFRHLFDPIHDYKSFQRLENLESLDLSYNGFNSSVLPFLSAARSLKILNLGNNLLEGVIPPNDYKSFQRLENLESLDLSLNQFNSSVLPFLSAARSLRILNLGSNSLEGVFPPNGFNIFRELEELDLSNNRIHDFEAGEGFQTTKLRTLDLHHNAFSDRARLKGLEHLVELEALSLAENQFNNSRSIQVLKDMPKLQELDLSNNEFTDLDSLGSVLPSSLQVLNLRDNQLSWNHEGYSKFCGLINLQELDLRNNALTSMPNCLGNISRLRTLELSDNQLNGNQLNGLPPELEYLSLLGNNFNGSFLFNSLVNQTRLKIFKLSSKVGTIQAQAESPWVPLFQLKMLELHNFILGSRIPGFLVHQHDLFYVDLSYNKLTGKFPRWLVQNNTRLQYILLNNNLLTELELPRRVHHGLKYLDISSNMIYGSIQEDIGIVFPKLVFMNFSSNQFHGTIPSSMGEMNGLKELDMSSNGLSGQLPKTFWSGCYSLVSLKLSNNQFQGEIFPEHANLTHLRALYLDGNNFTGCIGEGLLNSKYLLMLDLSDNKFSGMVPLWMGRLSSLWFAYMSGNQLRGPFPHQLLQSLQLYVLDISHNSFSGSIPRNVDFSSLGQLRLQNNGFWGSIPDTLFTVEVLVLLDLRNNNFSGKIPNTIGERSGLRVLLLGNNSLQSHIPEKICQLSKVGILDLSHNMFNGVIPSCLSNLSLLDDIAPLQSPEIYLGNSLSPNWNYTTDLHSINYYPQNDVIFRATTVVDLLTKSRYDAYQGYILRYMYGLDLSSNRLSGEIPVEIGDLENIKSLNLSSNRLTGTIPYNISNLKDLESLDLSNNKLHGNIPPLLADLDSLGYFNVSCNNFSGEIPFKGHLVTFDDRSYIGNAHLCGRPTNIICNPTRVPKANASTQAEEEEDDHLIDMEWFYWTCGAVYISTCLALFAFLCIDTRWSQEWFYRVDLFIHHLQRFKRSAFRN